MAPETWADVANYLLLAVGAAMAVGTGTALLRYRRDGVFPGQQVDDDGRPVHEPSVRSAYVKVGLGTILALYGLAGLTAGAVIGF
jgi:hypothetical protein